MQQEVDTGLRVLEDMEYPGRFIILGRDPSGEHNVIVYGVTGRSDSSRARILEVDPERTYMIGTASTDSKKTKEGNEDYLLYPSLYFSGRIIVGNGKQTESVIEKAKLRNDPLLALCEGHKKWDYEFDSVKTPRISGCVIENRAALGIIRAAGEEVSEKKFYEFPLFEGRGKFIATYNGSHETPEAFSGEPLDVRIMSGNPKETAWMVYNALAPKEGGREVRVSVAVLYQNRYTKGVQKEILNYHDVGAP